MRERLVRPRAWRVVAAPGRPRRVIHARVPASSGPAGDPSARPGDSSWRTVGSLLPGGWGMRAWRLGYAREGLLDYAVSCTPIPARRPVFATPTSGRGEVRVAE